MLIGGSAPFFSWKGGKQSLIICLYLLLRFRERRPQVLSEIHNHAILVYQNVEWDALAQAQAENAQRMKESEEYKATIKSMEEQLGRSHISFNKIAECILRLPTFEMQSQALQYVNFLLTGTGWSAKAEEVMTRIFAEVKEHSQKYEVHIGTLNNNGTLNEISGSQVQLPEGGADLPKIA